MIRKSLIVFVLGAGLSACASGKVQTSQQAYPPAQFIVTDVTVDVEAKPRPGRSFIGLTRSAAENLRQAYNREMTSSVGSYTLELSLQEFSVASGQDALAPITSNSLSMIATVRHPETGVAMRTYPVKYQLVRETSDETREEQLLRGALPAAFNGVYGMPATPEPIRSVVKSNQIFDGLGAEPSTVPVVQQPASPPPAPVRQNQPVQDVSTTSQDGGEPAVIECAIC